MIDATGLEVYPGMFDPVTQIGLNEMSAVSATVDISELGDYNPELGGRNRRESRERAHSRHARERNHGSDRRAWHRRIRFAERRADHGASLGV